MKPAFDIYVELVDQFQREAELVGLVGEALRRQRAAIAAADPVALDEENALITRTLGQLAVLRGERRTMVETVVGETGAGLARFEAISPRPLPLPYVDARGQLISVLERVQSDLVFHRLLLERALAAGEDSLRHLVAGLSGGADAAGVYGPGATAGEDPTGVLLRRSA
jgi:hypothetical protein